MQELIQVRYNELITHLRKDSCRVCGTEIVPILLCTDCKQPYQFECPKCKLYIDEQIHFGCKNVGDVI